MPWQGGAEQHGPYNNGDGGMWRTINSGGGGGLFADPAVVVAVQPGFRVSPGQPGYFKSETGPWFSVAAMRRRPSPFAASSLGRTAPGRVRTRA